MSASAAALVVMYNHKYEKNIPTIEAIYRGRFEEIFHLVPFHTGTQANVIPVYENSHSFQGYIAQGLRSFFRPHFMHYIFAADDLVLNPAISSANYQAFFKLDAKSSFIPQLDSLPAGSAHWQSYRNGILFDPFKKHGVEVRDDLPPAEEAAGLLRRHGVANGNFTFEHVYGRLRFGVVPGRMKANVHRLGRYLVDRLLYKGSLHRTKYPLTRSYSDIAVISAGCIRQFCHYCGVFAATDLFAELAIPTALALATDKIVTEKDLALRGKALWSAQEQSDELDKYGHQLGELFRRFPSDCLYIHPVKLSTWTLAN
jgi:hypothetical protein